MLPATKVVHGLVRDITPGDAVEAGHQVDTLRWLEATDDVFRRVKPATPDRHLVSYVAITDPADGSSLLVDHINAGLWLPPGGHVEPGEHPAETARRETREELAVEPAFVETPLDRRSSRSPGPPARTPTTSTSACGSSWRGSGTCR